MQLHRPLRLKLPLHAAVTEQQGFPFKAFMTQKSETNTQSVRSGIADDLLCERHHTQLLLLVRCHMRKSGKAIMPPLIPCINSDPKQQDPS